MLLVSLAVIGVQTTLIFALAAIGAHWAGWIVIAVASTINFSVGWKLATRRH
jgi:hypothetical protein